MRDTYNRGGDNIIGSATPGPIRQLLQSGSYSTLAELGEAIVQLQLSLHSESLDVAEARASSAQRSLVEQTVGTIVDNLTGSDEDFDAISAIPAPVAQRILANSQARETLPYIVLRRLVFGESQERKSGQDPATPGLAYDIDQWILANERTLRDDRHSGWRKGLVDYSSHADAAFYHYEMTSSALIIHRKRLPGYTILDDLRAPTLSIQPSFLSFQAMFAKITNGLLNGLDWSNVFVAGGVVLSSLLCTTDADVGKYSSSDIDIYIHGLNAVAANKKAEHIFDVWKSNLPESCREKTLVVRNSRTITFFSEYPIKRVQIVLKLIRNPKEVLLNFDLDVCAMGYDGTSLFMLPRAARALESHDYSSLTTPPLLSWISLMSLRWIWSKGITLGNVEHLKSPGEQVPGSIMFLRTESHIMSSVFKYADKGFGVRFLPQYVKSLVQTFPSGPGADHQRRRVIARSVATYPPDLERITLRAAQWTQTAIRNYERDFVTRNAEGLPEFTHGMLEERSTLTSEPGERSCLTSFELLMRHVELWREKVKGNIAMTEEVWASNNYDVGPKGYDDSPPYKWDQDFQLANLKKAIQDYNKKDAKAFYNFYGEMLDDLESGWESDRPIPTQPPPEKLGKYQRVSFAPDISSILEREGDVILLFFASSGFASFANKLVSMALNEHSLQLPGDEQMITTFGVWSPPWWREDEDDDEEDEEKEEGEKAEVLRWRIDSILGWQQIDRRIDEVFEILWSFYRCFADNHMCLEDVTRKFYTEVGRRAIRPTPTDEYEAFGRWVLRGAPRIRYSYGGPGQGFFGWTDDEDLDEHNQDNDEGSWFD
ncbi:hypothetical protein DL93DRAFT_2174350 [Clavulina sp. PMI_390]|nr:hypothetical protein DL93DRAFT_2174350 [Clavulina sp. PMI_390]